MTRIGREVMAIVCCSVLGLAVARNLEAQAPRDRAALITRIDSIVSANMKKGPIASVSVAVQQGPDLVLARGYGFADLENSVPASAETVYRLGSITKQFTAAAIMQQVEQGKIRLEDEITKFLPDYPTKGNKITIHHLLTHTSGIKSYTGLGPKFWSEASRLDLTHDQMLALFKNEPFDFAPGEKWLYNNSAFYLLGMILEKVTGRTYEDYVEKQLMAPLGMTASSYCSERDIVPHRANGYEKDKGALVNDGPISLNTPGAAGALCSTVLDLVRWQRALNEGRVVSKASHERMATEAKLNNGTGTKYGYGLGVSTMDGHRSVRHGGGINGFTTTLDNYPDDDLTVVVLTNTGGSNPGRIGELIARATLGMPLPVPKDIALAPERRGIYAGTYDVGIGKVRVFEDAGKLVADIDGLGVSRLMYQGGDAFVLESDPDLAVNFVVTGNRSGEVVLSAGGQQYRGKRVG